MKHTHLRHLFAAPMLAAALTGAAPASAEPTPRLEGMALVAALRDGGHSIYFRHAATDWSQDDRIDSVADLASCDPARMRQLSEAGRATMRRVGAAMRALSVPVGRLLASPYCRTVETAELLGFGSADTSTDIVNLRAAGYFGGRDAVIATAGALLAIPPRPGTNTVLASHGNLARAATGVYPGEGEALVFRPGGDGFVFVGRLTPADWQRLSPGSTASDQGNRARHPHPTLSLRRGTGP